MWSAAVDIAGQVGGQPGVRLSPVWLAIVVPVTVAAGTIVARAFTARDRIRRKYSADAAKVRDRVKTSLVVPALAVIVVRVQPLVDWPRDGIGAMLKRGDPGDPETEVRRRLKARHEFVQPLADLADHLALARGADVAQERLVANEKRQGWAAAVFLPAWLYLSFWASQTGVALPRALTTTAALTLGGSLGWFLCERFGAAREAEAFAERAAVVERLPSEEDSA